MEIKNKDQMIVVDNVNSKVKEKWFLVTVLHERESVNLDNQQKYCDVGD